MVRDIGANCLFFSPSALRASIFHTSEPIPLKLDVLKANLAVVKQPPICGTDKERGPDRNTSLFEVISDQESLSIALLRVLSIRTKVPIPLDAEAKYSQLMSTRLFCSTTMACILSKKMIPQTNKKQANTKLSRPQPA